MSFNQNNHQKSLQNSDKPLRLRCDRTIEFRSRERGQVVVEYVMILFICVACAAILTKALISRDPAGPGKMMSAWNRVLNVIGNDLPDCSGQDDFSKPKCR